MRHCFYRVKLKSKEITSKCKTEEDIEQFYKENDLEENILHFLTKG